MIIDSEGNPVGVSRGPFGAFPRAPVSVRATWILSFLALVIGVAAAAAFALWVAMILIPLAIIASGIASIIYRFQVSRSRKAVSPRY